LSFESRPDSRTRRASSTEDRYLGTQLVELDRGGVLVDQVVAVAIAMA
jgi:hypothetical protein